MFSTKYNGFKQIDFKFKDRNAILIFPNDKNKMDKWMLKTEYFDAFPNTEIALLKKGFHLAYLENINRWGTDADQDAKFEFSKFLSSEYGLSKKCVPVGMSCGGLHAVNFATKYPESISVLYLDAPVLNLLSCPAGFGKAKYDENVWQELVDAYGFTRSQLIIYRQHPIDKLNILIANNIPIVLVYGDSDDIVPYCENGAVMEKYYNEHNGKLKVIRKSGCNHHPHGLDDPSAIVDFIFENS